MELLQLNFPLISDCTALLYHDAFNSLHMHCATENENANRKESKGALLTEHRSDIFT